MALNKHLSPPNRMQLKVNQVEKIHPGNWRNWLQSQKEDWESLEPKNRGEKLHMTEYVFLQLIKLYKVPAQIRSEF